MIDLSVTQFDKYKEKWKLLVVGHEKGQLWSFIFWGEEEVYEYGRGHVA